MVYPSTESLCVGVLNSASAVGLHNQWVCLRNQPQSFSTMSCPDWVLSLVCMPQKPTPKFQHMSRLGPVSCLYASETNPKVSAHVQTGPCPLSVCLRNQPESLSTCPDWALSLVSMSQKPTPKFQHMFRLGPVPLSVCLRNQPQSFSTCPGWALSPVCVSQKPTPKFQQMSRLGLVSCLYVSETNGIGMQEPLPIQGSHYLSVTVLTNILLTFN